MNTREDAFQPTAAALPRASAQFAPFSTRRIFVIGGIALILCGMILGDIFAAFILHPNANRIGENLLAATLAVAAHNPQAAGDAFQNIGGLLENRGTKVDAHSHMIGFGYIALLLALLQPFVAFSESARKSLAKLFLLGAALLPVGVFLIHYVGMAGSPFAAIGWASVFGDLGGFFVWIVCLCEFSGLWKHFRAPRHAATPDELLSDRSPVSRLLLSGGTLLILIGFLHGSYYAGVHLFRYEALDNEFLSAMTTNAAAGNTAAALEAVGAYGQLQGAKAVNIAAHAHIIEFGVLAILIAFFQPYVYLRERWKRIWAVTLLIGSLALPLFVLLELRWGLLAGGIADAGGLLVIIALFAMLVGIWRYTGKLDSPAGAS
ncbi:MAG: hypothetical protein ACRD59_02085 [Candidatus Acidiferrales bacterium]